MVTTSIATGGGGGGRLVEGVDEVSGRQWSAIHREANVQAQCMTWLFAYFDVSWAVHGGPQSQVPFPGRDAMEVRRGQGHMQPFVNQNNDQQGGIARVDGRAALPGILSCCALCILALIWGIALVLF